MEEESGGLICDEHLERLRAWIEAQQLADSPDVYHDQEGKALFFYYPIPHEMKKFWFLLNHSFTKKMSGKQLDRTRSASRLHWVKLTWMAGLPIVAPVHVPWFDDDFAQQPCADGEQYQCSGEPVGRRRSLLAALRARGDGLGAAPHVLFVGLAFFWQRLITIDIDEGRMTIE